MYTEQKCSLVKHISAESSVSLFIIFCIVNNKIQTKLNKNKLTNFEVLLEQQVNQLKTQETKAGLQISVEKTKFVTNLKPTARGLDEA